jgi:cytochrome c-type biogenesis protein CcmF
LLQDPALALHPPFLYFGYVGFSVVFSLAVAALIEGRVDAAWARWVRPWTLASWSFLTVGITLGAFWAYYELGWGGWWFWDPVENASFLPVAGGDGPAAFRHRHGEAGALRSWTVFLCLAAYSFSMLGAFLVRSGVLTSVHAFAVDPTRGVILLSILAVAAGAALRCSLGGARRSGRRGVRARQPREHAGAQQPVPVGGDRTVLLGTLYPLIVEAITGRPISVGPPYFNLTFAPLMAAALLILPAGAVAGVEARRPARRAAAARTRWPAAALAPA